MWHSAIRLGIPGGSRALRTDGGPEPLVNLGAPPRPRHIARYRDRKRATRAIFAVNNSGSMYVEFLSMTLWL